MTIDDAAFGVWIGERDTTSEQSVMSGFSRLTMCLVAVALLVPRMALAEIQCEGHELLSTLRLEGSCANTLVKIFASPNKKLHATVLPVDVSLNATPDMESRGHEPTSRCNVASTKKPPEGGPILMLHVSPAINLAYGHRRVRRACR